LLKSPNIEGIWKGYQERN